MLTVTNAARSMLLSKLNHRKAADDVAMRFLRKKRKKGWKLRVDRERLDDTVFIHEGRRVLLLDTSVAEATAALTLDVRIGATGAKLRLRRTANES